MQIDLESILSSLAINYSLEGTRVKVNNISSLMDATKDDFSFCYDEGDRAISELSDSKAGVILLKSTMQGVICPRKGQLFIFLDNPRFVVAQIINLLYKKKKMIGISSQAMISKSARIGSNCYIGDFVTVGEDCIIGDNTIIYEKVSLVQNCKIGNNCIIHPGAVIGDEGYSFERDENGRLINFPHLRGVKIGNNVEIFANTTVARGSLSDTVINDDTKVGNSVSIAHNVVIGKNSEIIAGSAVAGSTIIGNMCWIGLNSTVKHRIKIGNNVITGAGSVVIHDVCDNDIVAGIPAKSIKDKVSSPALYRMAGLR
jgi:UDP-3-O-[3-hydroxymyristoyl] glucosamine N-acyltransferase LpxD